MSKNTMGEQNREIRHRRPGPKYMTRSNDLATINEAHLIAELVLREYRRKKLWRRVLRALVTPLAFLAHKATEHTTS